jgi:hypothetical protein
VPSTKEELLKFAESGIREKITNSPNLAATFLRLGFHDCVPNGDASGCDGCINLSNPSNSGLLPAIQALSGIVADLESPALGVSRADIWAFAVLLAANVSQADINFMDEFQVGRKIVRRLERVTAAPLTVHQMVQTKFRISLQLILQRTFYWIS